MIDIVETETPKTKIHTLARDYIKNVPEQGDYSREDYFIAGASTVLGMLRDLVNEQALEEPKSGYEQGLAEGLIWSWETIAELYLYPDQELEVLLGQREG